MEFPAFTLEEAAEGEGDSKPGQKVPAVSSVIEKPQPKFLQQEAISLRWRRKKFASRTRAIVNYEPGVFSGGFTL